MRRNRLAAAVTVAFASAAAAQTQPATTPQTTPVETQPVTPQSQPGATMQTSSQAPQATDQSPTPQNQPATCQCPPTMTAPTGSPMPMTTSEPATTDQPAASSGQVTEAKASDIKAGASVYDQTGALVGKVVSVDADGAIVSTGKARAEVPLSSFGQNDKGLVVSVTKVEIDAQARKTKPKS